MNLNSRYVEARWPASRTTSASSSDGSPTFSARSSSYGQRMAGFWRRGFASACGISVSGVVARLRASLQRFYRATFHATDRSGRRAWQSRLSGFRPTFNDRLGQAYPTIPRSNDNKDAVILPGTRPFSYRQNRGIRADFVLILGDKPLGPARHPRA